MMGMYLRMQEISFYVLQGHTKKSFKGLRGRALPKKIEYWAPLKTLFEKLCHSEYLFGLLVRPNGLYLSPSDLTNLMYTHLESRYPPECNEIVSTTQHLTLRIWFSIRFPFQLFFFQVSFIDKGNKQHQGTVKLSSLLCSWVFHHYHSKPLGQNTLRKKEEKQKPIAVKYIEDGFVFEGDLVTCALRLTPSVLLNHFQSGALPCLGDWLAYMPTQMLCYSHRCMEPHFLPKSKSQKGQW